MPRFYFHTRSPNGLAPDVDGVEFDSLEEARAVAELAVREAIVEMVHEGEIRLDQAIEISDAQGVPLLVLPYDNVVRIAASD